MRRITTISCILAALAACDDAEPRIHWGVGLATFDAVALGIGAPRPATGVVAGVVPDPRMTLPTYDGSGQIVHLDILVEDTRVIMAMTPYPFTDDLFENPCVLVGTDGMAFTEVPGANPIVGAPAYDHNDDPDLRVDPRTGEYELLYLETLRPDRQTVVALRSRDLSAWTRRDAIVYDLAAGAPFIVSPAAIEVAGVTQLFVVELDPRGPAIERMTSADGATWDAAQSTPIAIDLGALTPWHIDVFRAEQGFAMLISAFSDDFNHQSLYLATSQDLETWSFRAEPLLAFDDAALDLDSLYRSSGTVSGDTLAVWYSHKYWQ